MHRAVGVQQADAQQLAHRPQLVALLVGVLVAHQRQGVHHGEVKRIARLPERAAEEGRVN